MHSALQFTVVDAFTEAPFKGNPAAVVVLPFSDENEGNNQIQDDILQAIAMQFNITETAFLLPEFSSPEPSSRSFRIRWFAPWQEIRLCGHATLASAFVVFSTLPAAVKDIAFETRYSGRIKARRFIDGVTKDKRIEIELPAGSPQPVDEEVRGKVTDAVNRSAGRDLKVLEVLRERPGGHPAFEEYVIAVLDPEIDIKSLEVNASELVSIVKMLPNPEVDFRKYRSA